MDITIKINFEDLTFSDNKKDIAEKPFVLPSYMQFIFKNDDFDTSVLKEIEKKLEHTPIKFVRRFNLPDDFSIVKSIEPDFRENVIYPALVFIDKKNGILTADINTKHSIKNTGALRDVNKDFFYYLCKSKEQMVDDLNRKSFLEVVSECTTSFEERDELKKQMCQNLYEFIFNDERKPISLEYLTAFKSYYDINIDNENIQNIHLSFNEYILIENYEIKSISYCNIEGNFYIEELSVNYKNSFKGILKSNKNHSFTPIVVSYYEDDSERNSSILNFYIYFESDFIKPQISRILHNEEYLNYGFKNEILFESHKLKKKYSEQKLQPERLKFLSNPEDKHVVCFLENSKNKQFLKIKNDLEINDVKEIDENMLIAIKINFKDIEILIEKLMVMADFHNRINKVFQEHHKNSVVFLETIKKTINSI